MFHQQENEYLSRSRWLKMPRTVSSRNERVCRRETWRPVAGLTWNDISSRGFVCEVLACFL